MPVVVFFEYISWQYSQGIQEYAEVWKNLHWFLWRFFSTRLLLVTLFQPFRRTSESYSRGFDPSRFAQTVLVNIVTRLVGVVVRSVIISIAFLAHAALFIIGSVTLVIFLTTPLVVPASIIGGILIVLL